MAGKVKTHTLFLRFGIWVAVLTLCMLVSTVVKISGTVLPGMFRSRIFIDYLLLNTVWILTMTIPVAALVAVSVTYVTGVVKNGVSFIRYLKPAILLGLAACLFNLGLTLLVIQHSNYRIKQYLVPELTQVRPVAKNTRRGDREMSFTKLMVKGRYYLRNYTLSGEQKHRERLKRIGRMYLVEAYKKITLPVTGVLLALFGALLGMLLAHIRVGRVVIISFFNLFIILLLRYLFIQGETWGDAGVIPPFIGMMLGPVFLLVLAAAVFPRCRALFLTVNTD